jgi:polyketide synthase 12
MMGSAPAFADHMHCCDTAFTEVVDWSVLDALHGHGGSAHLDRLDSEQLLLFSITTSLARQWQVLGLHPHAVLGHSTGEIAAAYIAGALSLSEAAKVLTLRCTAARAVSELERDDVMVMNSGPETTSASSPIDTCAQNLRTTLSGLQTRTADAAFISTVTGAGLDTSILDAEYWSANFRQPVQFEHAVRWASDHGYRTFIEASPHPELTAAILDSLGDCDDDR